MTALSLPESTAIPLGLAAELLDERPEVRPWLTPAVVMKYLASRSTPAKRKAFRELRIKIQHTSAHAREHMTDAQGLLNPGLMPQKLEDLRVLAPARAEVDDELVGRCKQAHSEVKRQIDLVNGLEGAPLVEAVTALQELVAAHVQDEETELFPRLADIASAAQLEALGARLLQAKQRVG